MKCQDCDNMARYDDLYCTPCLLEHRAKEHRAAVMRDVKEYLDEAERLSSLDPHNGVRRMKLAILRLMELV